MASIESKKDEWGDTIYFIHDQDSDYFWFDNFNDCRLDKQKMLDFLEKCINYLEESV